jgi:hypothetical protein
MAKLAHRDFKPLADARAVLVAKADEGSVEEFDQIIGDLTYDEAEELAEKLAEKMAGHDDVARVKVLVSRAEKGATLNKPVVETEGDRSAREEDTGVAEGAQEGLKSDAPSAEGGDGSDGKGSDKPTAGHAKASVSGGGETWKARIRDQQPKIRGLGL